MTKQVVNTRGKKIEDIKECLRARIENAIPNVQRTISLLRASLDYQLLLKEKNEQEISYLEKLIAKKERKQKK